MYEESNYGGWIHEVTIKFYYQRFNISAEIFNSGLMVSFFNKMMVVIVIIVSLADSALAWQIAVHHASPVPTTFAVIVMTIIALGVNFWLQIPKGEGNRKIYQ